MQTQKITLDFCQNDYKTVTVKQYDKDSRNLIVTCTDNGNIYKLDPTAQQCNVKMITPDNRPLYKPATINEDGTILVVFDEDMVHVGGTGELEFQAIEASTKKTISTMILTVIIVSSVYPDDAVIASEEFSALTNAILDVSESIVKVDRAVKESNEAIERIEQLENNIEVAESIRVTNENNREEAESNRETGTATAITNANVATQNANEATQDALEAISATNTATSNANTATQNANTVIAQMESLIKNDNLIHRTDLGVAGGVASLDENGNIPASQLPSFIDDVLNGTATGVVKNDTTGQYTATGFIINDSECIPESGKIYVDEESGVVYRWSGVFYVSLSGGVEIGTTSSSAYAGDRGLALENRVTAIEEYHNDIPASDIKFDNTDTTILGANVQDAIKELTETATSTKNGLLSADDKKAIDNYKNIYSYETTLSSAKWVGSSAPYTQVLSVEGLNNYNNCNVVVRDDITVEQENALINADITSISYDESVGLTFIASGVKPPIDIPILLKVGASMNVVEVPNYLSEIDVASNIFYDNTSSGTVASNVQSAIDEVNTNLASVNSALSYSTVQGATASNFFTIDTGGFSTFGIDSSYGTWFKVFKIGRSEEYVEIAIPFAGSKTNIMLIRSYANGTLSDWGDLAKTSDLANYLPKTGGALTGDLCAKRFVYGKGQGNGVSINSSSYVLAPFLSEAQFRLDNTTRAGYGFHNEGVNASYLYLDTASNRFMSVDNTGHVDKIMTSANFTISNGKLTINLD